MLCSFAELDKLQETWGFTSTETIKASLGRESWGGREFLYLTPTRYTVTTRMTALRWAAVWAIFMFHSLCEQSHKTVSIKPQFLKRKESRSGSNRGPSAYLPSALPLGHTGSQKLQFVEHSFLVAWLNGKDNNKKFGIDKVSGRIPDPAGGWGWGSARSGIRTDTVPIPNPVSLPFNHLLLTHPRPASDRLRVLHSEVSSSSGWDFRDSMCKRDVRKNCTALKYLETALLGLNRQ